jgi:signal transduction histidine kinase
MDSARFLAGGGEMGAWLRAHRWTVSPLKSPELWPQSLKTAIRIMLTSRQPIWVDWGEKLIFFYNDPYKAIIGGPGGETGRRGVLVVGLNRFRLFDGNYRDFWGLVVGQLAAAVANADAFEQERQRAEALPERFRERMKVVHRNGQRLLKLVSSLLDFSRIEAGRARANYEPTDLAR